MNWEDVRNDPKDTPELEGVIFLLKVAHLSAFQKLRRIVETECLDIENNAERIKELYERLVQEEFKKQLEELKNIRGDANETD